MSGYGRDESAPTPGGMFVTNFVGERNIINKPFAALSQTTSSRRGRFIVPANMNTPTKWRTKMHVRWNINTCAVKWIYVFDDVKMRVW